MPRILLIYSNLVADWLLHLLSTLKTILSGLRGYGFSQYCMTIVVDERRLFAHFNCVNITIVNCNSTTITNSFFIIPNILFVENAHSLSFKY